MKKKWPGSKEEKEEQKRNRELLTNNVRKKFDNSRTGQNMRLPEPPRTKEVGDDEIVIELPWKVDWSGCCGKSLVEGMSSRKSRRRFTGEGITLMELSFLLWATQGVRGKKMEQFRIVPSAAARHAFETYISVGNVQDLREGLYRFLPMEHSLVQVKLRDDHIKEVASASSGQKFIADAAVVFIWTAIPERMEWRFGPAAHKVLALDAGHLCQNLYLAAEGLDLGTCAIGSYDQERMDRLVGADGEDEFVIYLAPVGKV